MENRKVTNKMDKIMREYVPSDIAKLLKEKGFDGICQAYYDSHGFRMFNGKGDSYITRPSFILAPTHQQVHDWFWRRHGLWIEVSISVDLNGTNHWNYMVYDRTAKRVQSNEDITIQAKEGFYTDPMDAYNAAFIYCLRNLHKLSRTNKKENKHD